MNAKEKKGKLYKPVLFTVGALLLVEIIFGVFFTEDFGNLMVNMMYIVGDNFGWWINLLCVVGIFIGIAIVVARYGDVVIGGKDAKPDFTTWQWFSMSICGGIGCGLLFWAMGEPIYRKSLSFQSLVDVTFKRKMNWLTTLLHICCAWAVASGVSNSMGAGLMQISGGINAVFGVPQGPAMYLFITIFVAVFFILSCLTGIHKGLSYVSTACMICFFALLIYVVVFGDAQFIGKIGTEATGQILDNFFGKITYNNTLAPEDQWANEWSITYWNSFFIYAPVIGMFLARMGKGRTVRQFVLVEILVPSLFCCLFIAIFAGMIMKMQCEGIVDVWARVQELGMQTALYQVLGAMPFGKAVQVLFLVTVVLSFVTLADPNTSAMSTLCVHGQEIDSEPPRNIKIVVGVMVSVVAYLLVVSGGMDAVKGLLNIGGLLMTIPTLWLFLICFRLCGRLLKSKNYMISPKQDSADLKTVENGLELVVEETGAGE